MNYSTMLPYSIEKKEDPETGEELYYIYRNNKPCNGYQKEGFTDKYKAEEEIGLLLAEDAADAFYDTIDTE
jgi:hypothetical protein